jgi:hypothetical protein
MTRLQRLALAALFVLLACGDDDGGRISEALFEEDFESECAGAPCGWEQIAGAPGAARRVATFHAGEHALALEGERVVVRGPMPAAMAAVSTFAELQGTVSARCDAGATLDLRVATIDESVPGGGLDSFDARLAAPPTWENARLLVRLVPSGEDGGFAASTVRVLGVTLIKDGPGVCEIGDLRIDRAGVSADLPVGC